MMKLTTFFSLLCLCFFSLVHGQQKKPYRKPDYEAAWNLDNRFAIKITPTSALDPYGALFPVGLEYYSGYKYGFSLDIGIPLYYVVNNKRYDGDKQVNSDFKVRADIRHYFGFKDKHRYFYGGEVFYRNQQMTLHDTYFHFIDNKCYDFSEAKAIKDIAGVGFLMGRTQKCSDHFFLEAHLGVGIRVVNMSPQMDFSNTPSYFKGSFVSLELPNEDRIGDHDLNIYIPFAIKLSYLF